MRTRARRGRGSRKGESRGKNMFLEHQSKYQGDPTVGYWGRQSLRPPISASWPVDGSPLGIITCDCFQAATSTPWAEALLSTHAAPQGCIFFPRKQRAALKAQEAALPEASLHSKRSIPGDSGHICKCDRPYILQIHSVLKTNLHQSEGS